MLITLEHHEWTCGRTPTSGQADHGGAEGPQSLGNTVIHGCWSRSLEGTVTVENTRRGLLTQTISVLFACYSVLGNHVIRMSIT